jgi:hypothetical protein
MKIILESGSDKQQFQMTLDGDYLGLVMVRKLSVTSRANTFRDDRDPLGPVFRTGKMYHELEIEATYWPTDHRTGGRMEMAVVEVVREIKPLKENNNE